MNFGPNCAVRLLDGKGDPPERSKTVVRPDIMVVCGPEKVSGRELHRSPGSGHRDPICIQSGNRHKPKVPSIPTRRCERVLGCEPGDPKRNRLSSRGQPIWQDVLSLSAGGPCARYGARRLHDRPENGVFLLLRASAASTGNPGRLLCCQKGSHQGHANSACPWWDSFLSALVSRCLMA